MESKEQFEYMKQLIIVEKESRAKEIAHLFQRDAINYEDFMEQLHDNLRSYNYILLELMDILEIRGDLEE